MPPRTSVRAKMEGTSATALSPGPRLLAGGIPDLAGPVSPELLAGLHPLWAADIDRLGPWRLEQGSFGAFWLPARPEPCGVLVCGACASSMAVARHLAQEGALPPFASVLAAEQHAGRGQMGRSWLSAPGNLLVSFVCPPAAGPWNDLRPLVLGRLLAEALGGLGWPVQVKWPNDLLLDGRKVGGILVEERPGLVLAGLGLNLAWAPPEAELREGHGAPAGLLSGPAAGPGPLGLWLELEKRLETGYRTLLDTFTPSDFLTLFRAGMAWVGRRVLVQEGAGVRYEAVVRGVGGRGELVLDRAGGEVLLTAGDVTLA